MAKIAINLDTENDRDLEALKMLITWYPQKEKGIGKVSCTECKSSFKTGAPDYGSDTCRACIYYPEYSDKFEAKGPE